MLESIFGGAGDWGVLVMRLALGAILIIHGYPKLFGGMGGFSQFLGQLGLPMPPFWAWVVTLLEFFGGILLVGGLLTRWVALLLVIEFVVAITKVKWRFIKRQG